MNELSCDNYRVKMYEPDDEISVSSMMPTTRMTMRSGVSFCCHGCGAVLHLLERKYSYDACVILGPNPQTIVVVVRYYRSVVLRYHGVQHVHVPVHHGTVP